ncbi:MAG: response regulator [Myxococcota bacterium]
MTPIRAEPQPLPAGVGAEDLCAGVLSLGSDLALLVDADGTVRWVGPGWTRRTGHEVDDIVGRRHDFWVPEPDRPRLSLEGSPPPAHVAGRRFRLLDVRGRVLMMVSRGTWLETADGPVHLLVWQDLTALDAFGEGLVAMSRHEPLRRVLSLVLRGIEARFEAGVAWLQELDDDHHLRHLAGPHLPTGWRERMDGRAADDREAPTSRPCIERSTLVIPDLEATDAPFAPAVRRFGFRSMWSAPVRGAEGVLGVLTILWHEPREPLPALVRLLEVAASVIAVFVESARARVALQRAHRRLIFHMDNSPLAVIETDRRFRVTRWSDKAERMLGISASEALGRPLGELDTLADSDRERGTNVLRALHRSTLRRGVVRLRMKTPSGREFDAEWHVSALRDEDGEPVSYMALGQDLSERQAREEALRQTQKLESVGVLAGGIAHDFNNLLTSALGHTDLALERMAPDAPARRHVQQIAEAAERAADLTRQLLAYSGEGRFEMRVLELGSLISQMSELLAASVSKKVEVRYELDPEPLEVHADPAQLRQAVLNLVTNASEAMERRGGTVTIRTDKVTLHEDDVSTHFAGQGLAPGPYALLEVCDEGPGMDAETLSRAFDPYFSTKEMGRGLGLAAIAGIVRGHDGGIRMDSDPEQGTRARLYLPAASGHGERRADPPPEPEESGERTGGDGPGGVVLVVDDETWVRQFIGEVLADHGHQVLYAVDGEEAVEVYRERGERIDLVILDMTMPRLGGAETLDALRTLDPDTRVVVTSGYTREETASAFGASQPDGFLQKPFRMHTLLDKVAEILG